MKPTRHDFYQLPLWRKATGRLRALPDFVILGAQKAGTTTIYDNLIKHPSVAPSSIKEVHYFDSHWAKGANWYRGHFPFQNVLKRDGLITGEGSPYYLFHPLAPQRLKETIPAAKLIVVLRNPVDRAYSHYQHEVRKGREPFSFEDALERELERISGEEDRILNDPKYQSYSHQHYSYAARGIYAPQLERWFQFFPREQFIILLSEDLNQQFEATFATLQQFLGIKINIIPVPKRSNVSDYTPMKPDTRNRLNVLFQPPNQRLSEMLGMAVWKAHD